MHPSLKQNQLYITVDIMIMTVRKGRLLLLLSKRKDPPYADHWALPGKLVEQNETAEAAVRRLLEEMLPGPEPYIEQLYTFTGVDRDPRGRVISLTYLVCVPWAKLQPFLPSSTFHCFHLTSEEERLSLKDENGDMLQEQSLAFDHGHIIRTGLTRLRGKIDYSEIGFSFLEDPQAFSLSELQNVFEAVMDSALDASNFRRFIRTRYEKSGRIQLIDKEEKRGRGRPANLYRLSDEQNDCVKGGAENE